MKTTLDAINAELKAAYASEAPVTEVVIARADQHVRLLIVRRDTLASDVIEDRGPPGVSTTGGTVYEDAGGRLVLRYPQHPSSVRMFVDPPREAAAAYIAAVREAYRLRNERRAAPASVIVTSPLAR